MVLNRLLEDIILPVGDWLNGSCYIKQLKYWRKAQYFSSEELVHIQLQKLGDLLRFAVKNVPFYKDIKLSDDQDPIHQLRQFPILDKVTIKTHLPEFLSTDMNSLIPHSSSGSSGIQGTIYMNKQEQSITRAIQTLWWEWAGFKIGEPLLQTGMTTDRGLLKTLKDLLFRTTYVQAFGLNEPFLLDVLKKTEAKPQRHLGGYASSLYQLAKVADQHDLNIKFQSVISWGDKMFDHYRKQIKSAFHCDVTDTYGVTEGMMIACQMDLPYYYIMTPHVFLEILDHNGEPVPDGELGNVVVTRLDAFSMPIIRYRLGDLAVKLPLNEYPPEPKLNFPLLKKIVGRDTDVVRTSSGEALIVHFFTAIFEFIPEIKQFQVIHTGPDEICIDYIPDRGFETVILENIRGQINDHLKKDLKIDFRETSKINPTASGKPQIVQIKFNETDQSLRII